MQIVIWKENIFTNKNVTTYENKKKSILYINSWKNYWMAAWSKMFHAFFVIFYSKNQMKKILQDKNRLKYNYVKITGRKKAFI